MCLRRNFWNVFLMEIKLFKEHFVNIFYIWYSHIRKIMQDNENSDSKKWKLQKIRQRKWMFKRYTHSSRQENSVRKNNNNILIRSDTLFTFAQEMPRREEHNWRTFRSCSTTREHLINKNVLHNVILLHYFHWKGMKTKTALKCIPPWR